MSHEEESPSRGQPDGGKSCLLTDFMSQMDCYQPCPVNFRHSIETPVAYFV
jgi:hypothetical protein